MTITSTSHGPMTAMVRQGGVRPATMSNADAGVSSMTWLTADQQHHVKNKAEPLRRSVRELSNDDMSSRRRHKPTSTIASAKYRISKHEAETYRSMRESH